MEWVRIKLAANGAEVYVNLDHVERAELGGAHSRLYLAGDGGAVVVGDALDYRHDLGGALVLDRRGREKE